MQDNLNDTLDIYNEAQGLMIDWAMAAADKFRNPLAGLRASMDIIQSRLAALAEDQHNSRSEKQLHLCQKAIRMSYKNLYALDEFVSDLIEFSKPLRLEAGFHPVAALIQEGMHKLEQGNHHRNLPSIKFRQNAKQIYCDLKAFLYAFKALTHNAFEAIPFNRPCKVEISLLIAHDAQNRRGTLLQVEDNGQGFAEDLIEEVTKPFWSNKEASSGMGLTVCQKIAMAHHGYLRIENKRPRGSRVSLFFPHPTTSDAK